MSTSLLENSYSTKILRCWLLTQEEDGAESRMDDYDYEYVDDDDASLELDEISERLKRLED